MHNRIRLPKVRETSEGLLGKDNVLYTKDKLLLIFQTDVTKETIHRWIEYLLSGAIEAQVESIEYILQNVEINSMEQNKVSIIKLKDIAVIAAKYPPLKGRIVPTPVPIPVLPLIGVNQLRNVTVLKSQHIYGKRRII
jgi:hypothetical protein